MTGSAERFWTDRSVLVTGATGFLGDHVVSALGLLGSKVVALVRDQLPEQTIRPPTTIVRGDITDQSCLERVLGDYDVATVLHLAAQSQVEVANRNPVETFESNIRGTWSVLEAVRRSPTVQQVVVASSDKAYGTHPVLPYREDMPLLAVHPYDVSKACADLIAISYHQVFGVPVSITRCGNLFGPGDRNWARVIPSTVRALLRHEQPIIRSDGSPIRDYLYAEDAALGYICLVEAMANEPGTVGQAFNLSAERPLSVLELVTMVARVMEVDDLDPVIEGRAAHEISAQHLSAEKARKYLGWQPKHSMEEALASTAGWYRRVLMEGPRS